MKQTLILPINRAVVTASMGNAAYQARFGFQLRAELFFKFGGFDELFRVAEKADVVTVVIAEWFKPGQFGQLCQPRIVAELRMGIERQVYPVQADIVSEHDPEPFGVNAGETARFPAPGNTVMNEDKIEMSGGGVFEQRQAAVHAEKNAFHFRRAFDLESVV